jgi:hypothetical protein
MRGLSIWCVALVLSLAAGLSGTSCAAQAAPGDEEKPHNNSGQQNARQDAKAEDDARNDDASVKKISWRVKLLKDFATDQEAIWTSPAHVRLVDADWLIPLGAATGIMLATDTDFSRHLSNSPSRLRHANDFSNYGIGALAGAGAGFYFLGVMTHDPHEQETGLLAGEAAIDVLDPLYAMKYAFARERPQTDNSRVNFFSGGDSIP